MPPVSKLRESRLRPLAGSMPVREARDVYLAENGFTTEAYDARFTEAMLFGLRFRIPNTARHRWALRLHDLHHALTGYGTDLYGEIEMSAWECRRGLRRLGLYVGGIVLGLTLFGLLVSPWRTWCAWRDGAGRGSLFQREDDYETLLELPLGELRQQLEIPPNGLRRGRRGLHAGAPGVDPLPGEAEQRAPSHAIALLFQVTLLLCGLATYLLASDTGGREAGYAFVVAIHLLILASVCVALGVRLLVRRSCGPP